MDSQLDYELMVTGMHLSYKYGYTINDIENQKFKIGSKIDMLLESNTHAAMAKSIGIGIIGITQSLEISKPEFVMLLGDRGEMLAGAIAAAHMNIPILHLHGGEVSGSIDDTIRHSISKFSHFHFTSSEKSKERLIKSGEEAFRIKTVGAPALDSIINETLPPIENVFTKYGIPFKPTYYLVVFHPVTTESAENVEIQVKNTLQLLLSRRVNIICILPNSDAGSELLLNYFKSIQYNGNIFLSKNFSHLDYLSLLKNANALIGNSSSGIIEAASFKVPVLNIGERQRGRDRNENVVDCDGSLSSLERGFNIVDSREFTLSLEGLENIYGNGKASMKIISTIKKLSIDKKLLNKKFML